jgi:pseudaminic acid synthase
VKINLPFFIAEISANHCGNLNLAKKLIKCAKINGANAVKLQTFTPDSMTIKSDNKYFKIKTGLWKGYKLWDLYNEAQTPLLWHKELFSYAKKIGITIFSSVFNEEEVDFLEKLRCPIYKVSSFEMTDISLIKKIAKTNKPIIISTGMASLDEIELSYKTAKKYGSLDITLLYCVSNYPSKITDFNLHNLQILKNKFNCRIGLSDHSVDNRVAISAIAAGAEMIEKHIALDNQKKGLDIKFAIKGKKIKKFKEDIDMAYNLLGKKKFYRNKSEEKSKSFKRSIFAIKDIMKGEKFSKNNIKKIRPGYGVSPKYYEKLLRKKSPFYIKKEKPINKKCINKLKLN